MSLLAEFAERLIAFRAVPLQPDWARAAEVAFTDTLACILLGAQSECARIVRETPGICEAQGPCRVLGTDISTSALDAALANGTASHADDFDDFTQAFGGHPSAPILPAALAVAEMRGLGGAALLSAYVAGVELETRIAHGVHYTHYRKGWHPTSTLGVFGAAAAVAQLLELDRAQTTTALAIAASHASGLKANFGTMTKPLHVGHCARAGLLSALLAQGGFTASADALEHPHGFLEVYNGAGSYDISLMRVPWFAPPLLVSPGLSLKQFACCGSTHPAIYMAMQVRERLLARAGGVDPDAIASVAVKTHPFRMPHTDNPQPHSPLEAKFSSQYVVARALLDGPVRLAHFEPDAVAEAPVRSLMSKVTYARDDAMAEREDRAFGADLTVRLSNGEEFHARTENLPGRGPEYPITTQELKAKFDDCARDALSERGRASVWAMLSDFAAVPDVSVIGRAIAENSAGAAN